MRFTIQKVHSTPVNRGGHGRQDTDTSVELVKVVIGFFFSSPNSVDGWMELVLGNKGNVPIQIDAVDLKIIGSEVDIIKAPSETTTKGNKDRAYLYREPFDSDWKSMYEEFARIQSDNSYFSKHSTSEDDKVFLHTLGKGKQQQRLILTPVEFHTNNEKDNGSTECSLEKFLPLKNKSSVTLAPKDIIASKITEPTPKEYQEYVDTIGFWIEWNAKNLIEYHKGENSALNFIFTAL